MKKSRSVFDPEKIKQELTKLENQMQDPNIWTDTAKVTKIGQDIKEKKEILEKLSHWSQTIEDAQVAIELGDKDLIAISYEEIQKQEKELEKFELQQMLSGEYDSADAILTINSGAGGTDAQDWASMLLRMYMRWAESRVWKVELLDKLDEKKLELNLQPSKFLGSTPLAILKPKKGSTD